MFVSVSEFDFNGVDKTSRGPGTIDCQEILNLLNDKYFFDRALPDENLRKDIKKITDEMGKPNDEADCHCVTEKLTKKYRPDLKVVHGYLLAIATIQDELIKIADEDGFDPYIVLNEKALKEINKRRSLKYFQAADQLRKGAYSIKIEPEFNRAITILFHHALVENSQGNFVECIYARYPLCFKDNRFCYAFLPHKSASLKVSLTADLELMPKPV